MSSALIRINKRMCVESEENRIRSRRIEPQCGQQERNGFGCHTSCSDARSVK